MNGHTISLPARTLPPPLSTAPDMASTWGDVELDFDTAADRIVRAHRNDGAARDLPILDLKTWAIGPKNGAFALIPLAGHHPARALRGAAFNHLMTRIGAPADFLRKLPAPLQLATANYLLTEHVDNAAATLRLRGDEVSAVVSGRYAPLDPEELVDTVRAALVRHGLLASVRVRATASGLVDNMRLVLESESVAVKPGDVTAVGIDITASSFARSAIHVSPVLWRLVCSNGLKRSERRTGFSFRHVGDAQRLRDGVAEAIPSALVHARGVMDQWRTAVDWMMDDVLRQVDELRDLTVVERKNVEHELQLETGSPSLPERVPLYSFVNALTASAKQATPARRLELEAIAGDVLQQQLGRE